MSITPVYLSIKTPNYTDYAGLPSFYKVLKLFNQDLISEWVEAGNNREDFTEKGSKIVIVSCFALKLV